MKYLFTLCISFSSLFSYGQTKALHPVAWDFEVVSTADGNYLFRATASLEDNWAMYSQYTGEGGPIPLSFAYDNTVQLIGETEEKSEPIKHMSKLFGIEVVKFKHKAIFEQKFSSKKEDKNFSGTLTFMCCDSKRCLPPTDINFDIAL